jgi:hypothetical protein
MTHDWRLEATQAKVAAMQCVEESLVTVPPRVVIEALAARGHRRDAAKRAIWYLIDDGKLHWTHSRFLELPPSKDS